MTGVDRTQRAVPDNGGRVLLAVVLGAVTGAAVAAGPGLSPWPVAATCVLAFALAVALTGHARVSRGAPAGVITIDPAPVFLIPACVLLPPIVTVVMIALAQLAMNFAMPESRGRRRLDMAMQTVPAYAVAGWMAHAAVDAGAGAATAAATAAAAYFVTNVGAVLVYARLVWGRSVGWMLAQWTLWALDGGTSALAFLTATATTAARPWAAFAAVPVCLLCEYAFMRPHIEAQLNIDSKSDLANAKGMAEAGQALAHAAARSGAPLSALMIDIDHFKAVNDQHGHPAGDQVIREIAERLRATLRADAAVGRIGGEEYLALLPGADLHAAVVAAERVRAVIAASAVQTHRGPVAVTVSIGCAAIPATAPSRGTGGEQLSLLTSDADVELYRAKAAGRNRVYPELRDVPAGEPVRAS